MAKAKYIREVERDAIRIGVHMGLKAPAIANYLGRGKQVVYNEIAKMTDANTITNIPLEFLVEAVGRDMMRIENTRQAGMKK